MLWTEWSSPPRASTLRSAAVGVVGGVTMGLAAVAWSNGLASTSRPAAQLVFGAIGLVVVLALALARFDVAVLAGILLLGVVQFEPAPSDAILGLAMAIAVLTRRSELRQVPRGMAALVALLVLANVLSAGVAIAPIAAALFFGITLYLVLLALFIAAYVDRRSRARALVIAYAIAAVSAAVLGTLAVLTPLPGRELLLLPGGCCRARGLFKDANVFGPFLIPALLILLNEAITPRLISRRARPILVVAVLLLELGVLVSFSRAAWLNLTVGLVVMVGVLALRRRGSRRVAAALALVIATAGVAFGIAIALGEERFFVERAALQAYDDERFSMQREGLAVATTRPLGIGPGQFGLVFPADTHEVYIRVAAEQGAVGAVAFLGIVIGTLIAALRNVLAGSDTYGIDSAALLGSWCGLIANGLFVDSLHWRHLWLIAGLIWAGSVRRRSSCRRR